MSVSQQQLLYLKAMGIPVWVDRYAIDAGIFEGELEAPVQTPKALLVETGGGDSVEPVLQESLQTLPSGFSTDSLLEAIDNKPAPLQPVQNITSKMGLTEEASTKVLVDCSGFDWQQLQSSVIGCQQCDLHRTRTQTIFGGGIESAAWMIVGDAPREEDDLQGKAFMGRSGELLNNMLLASGMDRSKVYLTNVLKCRPPNNRDAKQAESKACYSYLKRQVELVKPSLLLVVGRIAAQHLLKTSEPLARLRGRIHHIEGIDLPVIVTYHPAYLLRQPRNKYKSWEDLKQALSLVKPF